MESVSTPAAKRSIWAIVGDVFFAPTKAFESFKFKPTLWVPLILVVLAFAVVAYVGYQYDQQATRAIYDAAPNLSAAARAQIDNQPSFIGPEFAAGMMLIMFPIITIVGSLIAWMFISFFFGKKSSFKDVWATNLLTGIVVATGALIHLPLMIAKGSVYVSLGPAALMAGSDYTSYFFTAMTQLDVFTIWWVVVSAIGYSVVFGISKAQGAAISITLWLIGTLLFMSKTIGFAFAGVETTFF